jgi:hypothetical protein
MSGIDFRAFGPPVVETMAANWRNRFNSEIRHVLAACRRGEFYAAMWRLGRADTTVSVLYDLNHPSCYHCLKRLEVIRRFVETIRSRTERSADGISI